MANLFVPVDFTQFAPYVRGTLTYRWFDTALVQNVQGGDATADGIVSITSDTVAGTATVTFDSNVDATVDLAAATTGLFLQVPNDVNDPVYVEATLDCVAGSDNTATTQVTKTVKHTFVGISDTILNSFPANPTFNETEVVAGTRKSLGTFNVPEPGDTGATYTATLSYDKTQGNVTYLNESYVTARNTANDVITTSNVELFNDIISDMQYLPLFQSNPAVNQDALVGQTLQLSVTSDVDSRIQGTPTSAGVNIDNTLQLAYTGPAPSFKESEGSGFDAVGKSLGGIGISPSLNISGITFTANITYDHSIGSITYPNPGLITTQGNTDSISSSDIAVINNELQNCTYLPTSIASGGDLETIQTDSIVVSVSSSPQLTIQTPTQTITTTISTSDTEFSGLPTSFDYNENTTSTNVFTGLQVNDLYDNDAGTNEMYAVVFDSVDADSSFELVSTYSYTVNTYSGGDQLPSTAKVLQGLKAEVNGWLSQNPINYHPQPLATGDRSPKVQLYRLPPGTTDINLNINTDGPLKNNSDLVFDGVVTANNIDSFRADPILLQNPAEATVDYQSNFVNSENLVQAAGWVGFEGIQQTLPAPRLHYMTPTTANVKLTISSDSTLSSTEFGNIEIYDFENDQATTRPPVTETYTASTQTYEVEAEQGSRTQGADDGLNTITHQFFNTVGYVNNLGQFNADTDVQTANLTYTASTTSDTFPANVSIPYLLLPTKGNDGHLDFTNSPFNSDTSFVVSAWVELNSAFDSTTLNGAGNYAGYTPVPGWFTAGGISDGYNFEIVGRLERRGNGTPTPDRYLFTLDITTASGTARFSNNLGTSGVELHKPGESNHMVLGFDLANGKAEFCLNNFSCQLARFGPPYYQGSFPTGLQDVDNFRFINSLQTGSNSVIAFGTGFQEGDIATVSGEAGDLVKKYRLTETSPSTVVTQEYKLLSPYLELNDQVQFTDAYGVATKNPSGSWKVRGSMGGNATETSAISFSGRASKIDVIDH